MSSLPEQSWQHFHDELEKATPDGDGGVALTLNLSKEALNALEKIARRHKITVTDALHRAIATEGRMSGVVGSKDDRPFLRRR